MSQNHREVNIGTPEKPILVPHEAVADPNSKESIQWWHKFASGMANLSPEAEKALFALQQNNSNHEETR